jgi:hypothetical protein
MPLWDPNDAEQYRDRQPQEIRMEHPGGSKKAWACCGKDVIATQVEVIARPALSGRTLSSHHTLINKKPDEPKSYMQEFLRRPMAAMNRQCGACSQELVQEISIS